MTKTLAAALTIAALVVSDARAQSKTTVVPSMAISTVYDGNLFSTPQSQGDALLRLRPALETSHESQTLTFLAVGSLDMQRAINYWTLNSFDARRHALVETQLRATPVFSVGFAGRYDRSDTPDELNFDSGILGERRRAVRLQLTPSFNYRTSPRTTITGSYDTTLEEIVGGVEGSLRIARLNILRQVSERDTFNIGALQRDFFNGPEHRDSTALFAGWTRILAPAVSLSIQGGPRRDEDGHITPEILASLTRTDGSIRYGFDFWRGQTIVLGIKGPVDINSATARVTWPLRRHVEIGTHFGYFDSVTLERATARVMRGSVVGAWTPGGFYTVAISYGADFQRGDIRSPRLSDREIFRHVFLVQLTVAPRLSRVTQPTGPADPRARPKGDPK